MKTVASIMWCRRNYPINEYPFAPLRDLEVYELGRVGNPIWLSALGLGSAERAVGRWQRLLAERQTQQAEQRVQQATSELARLCDRLRDLGSDG